VDENGNNEESLRVILRFYTYIDSRHLVNAFLLNVWSFISFKYYCQCGVTCSMLRVNIANHAGASEHYISLIEGCAVAKFGCQMPHRPSALHIKQQLAISSIMCPRFNAFTLRRSWL
jgi:hypothetical protein